MKELIAFIMAPIGGMAIATAIWWFDTEPCSAGGVRCSSTGASVHPDQYLAIGGVIGLVVGIALAVAFNQSS